MDRIEVIHGLESGLLERIVARLRTVARATLRLGRELLAFLRERDPNVDPQPDIARFLADGTLERRLGFPTD